MDIILVNSTFNGEVHGTENGKKTGCGINLTKPENVTKYLRGNIMTDLKELTCEKCKTVMAKKMIKADKKEMAKLLKEEKLREKNGFGDDGIVPLGNTTAKITKSPKDTAREDEERRIARQEREADEKRRREEEQAAAERAEAQARLAAEREEQERLEAERQAELQKKTITGTGIAMDPSLAEFAINVPKNDEEEVPEQTPQDDFLAQFAIQKPAAEEAETAPAAEAPQDDFLAKFAIPSANTQDEVQEPVAEEPRAMDEVSFAQPEPQTIPEPAQPINEPAAQADAAANTNNEWDTLANQLFGYNAAPDVPQTDEMAELSAPANNSIEPASASRNFEPELDDIAAPTADTIKPAYRESTPVLDDIFSVESHENDNREFYSNGSSGQLDEIVQQADDNYSYNDADELEIPEVPQLNAPQSAPSYEEPEIPEVPQLNTPQSAPSYEEPEIPEVPQLNTPQSAPSYEEPEIPEVPQLNTPQSAPSYEGPEIPEVPQLNTPQSAPSYEEPEIPEIPQPEPISAPEPAAAAKAEIPEIPSIPDIPDVNSNSDETDDNGEMDDMSKYRYSTPIFADEVKKPVQPAAPQVAPGQPQIINIPQFAGYDVNGQPVYTYVQMQITGYEKNGQPILAPLPNQPGIAPVPQAAPVAPQVAPQAAAPVAPQVTPQAAAPVAPQAAPQAAAPVAPRKPVQPTGTPTANISKIAVHQHSKPMSQAFVDAISISRETGNKNLIETQGLRANTPVLTSVEDVLSQMDGKSASTAKKRAAANATPVFQEYKAPTKSTSAPKAAAKTEEKPAQFMTKAELKAKKKQDKIDAKFRKEMAKRGL